MTRRAAAGPPATRESDRLDVKRGGGRRAGPARAAAARAGVPSTARRHTTPLANVTVLHRATPTQPEDRIAPADVARALAFVQELAPGWTHMLRGPAGVELQLRGLAGLLRASIENASAIADEDVPFFMAETLDGLAALVSVTAESDEALLKRYRVEVRS